MTEIAYDDGIPETTFSQDIGGYAAVRFSLPASLSKVGLLVIRIYKAGRSATDVKVHVLGSDVVRELMTPFTFRLALESAWNDVDVRAHNIAVSGDFYVAVEYLMFYDPLIGQDATNPKNRSYYGHPRSWSLINNGENIMIRVLVDSPITLPPNVSQVSLLNTVIILALYVMLAGLVTLACIPLIVKRRKYQ